MRKSTLEERLLGLDPSKYTQKPWSPNKYADSGAKVSPAMSQVANELRMKAQQNQMLGPEMQAPSPEEAQEIKKQMILRMMGDPMAIEDQRKMQLEADKAFYAMPEKQNLIRELGLQLKDGIPVLDDEDEEKFQKSVDLDEKEMDRRSQMLLKLFTHE